MNKAEPATPLPPDGDTGLPPELAAVETLLQTQSAGWQPPARLRETILHGRIKTTPLARIRRQTRWWWNGCAAAVLLLAALHLAVLADQPASNFGGLTPRHAPLARRGDPRPHSSAARDTMAALPWDPAFRAQLLSPAFRLVPAVDWVQFKKWTGLETLGVGS